jgi:hypothetical protein
MSAPLTVEVVADRLINFPLDRYLYIGSIMRGVSLALGSYVLVEILRDWKTYWRRIFPWIGALLATMVTLTTWGRGVLLTNSSANVGDAFFPLLMGIIEFGLFAILSPQKSLKDGRLDHELELLGTWFLVLGTHSFLAFLLVSNRILQADFVKDFEPNLRQLANELMQWMDNDRLGSSICAPLFYAVGWLVNKLSRPLQGNSRVPHWILKIILWAVTVLPIAAYVKVVWDAESQRQRIDDFISTSPKRDCCSQVSAKIDDVTSILKARSSLAATRSVIPKSAINKKNPKATNDTR